MEQKKSIDYSKLTDEELSVEFKKLKKDNLFNSFVMGLLFGISVYSIVKNGFGFLPVLFFAVILFFYNKSANYRAADKEVKQRGIVISK